jgi:periplasmic nitrate reductase NapD
MFRPPEEIVETMNVCSVVVYTKPERSGAVTTKLEEFNGVEVHGGQEEGKLVVTVEGGDDDKLADTMAAFNDVDGVINTVMIYHYCGDENVNEEVTK